MENQEKDHIKNLDHKEAIDKLKELAESASVCMFETFSQRPPFNARPMSPIKIDDEGNLWFFSNKNSGKNKDILTHPIVQLYFSNIKNSEFLNIYGTAKVFVDQEKFDAMWSPIVKIWFPKGKDDPNLSLIKVTPEHSYYWDTKHNKMVALLKMAVSVFSGKTMDDGVEGTLEI